MPIDFFEGQRQVNTWGYRVRTFLRSTVFKRTSASCGVLSVYLALGHAAQIYSGHSLSFSFADVTMLGGVLSVVLVLRTNSAYDRWWEGRKLWGQLVNDSRNLALKIQSLVEATPAEKARAAAYISAFPFCLRDHLRCGPSDETLKKLPEPLPEGVTHVPAYISGRLFELLKEWRNRELVHRLDHHLIDRHISALMDICGACERIRNSPLPLSHRALVPQLLMIYLLLVPLGIPPTLRNWALVLGLSYFLIGLEMTAEEIEEPFGTDHDDLPLDTLSTNIGRVVNEIFTTEDE